MHELTDERLAELRTIASNVGVALDYGRVDDDNTETVAEWMSNCSDDPEAPAAGRLWAVYAPTDEREGLTIGAITGDGPQAQYYAEHIAAFDPPTVIALLDELERLRGLEVAAESTAAQALRDAAEVMRSCKDPGHWNLRDPHNPEVSYSPDAWLCALANQIQEGEPR